MESQVARLINFQPLIHGADLAPVSVDLNPGTITCVLGPSGCGKTSLLRAVHGEIPYTGRLDQSMRSFMVYQGLDQLFPWTSVAKNVQLTSDSIDHSELADLSARWGVGDLLLRRPSELSGGQRQRFALIRALLSDRDLILCDEPLSGVDRITAEQIAQDLAREVHERQIKMIWVTHDWHEASILADQLVIYKGNRTRVYPSMDADEIHAKILA